MSDLNQQNQRSLGRGLKSLLGGSDSENRTQRPTTSVSYFPKTTGGVTSQIIQVDIDKIKTNPHQPREVFDVYPLEELVQSIREYGILQPLVVTQVLGGQYELIAGERRLRAAKKVGYLKVPVIVRSAKELEKLEISLIENIQRQDLNPIERAKAYLKLVRDFHLSQDEVAKKMGKSKSSVSNSLRLLTLPKDIQDALMERKLTEGQAKIILELKDHQHQKKVFNKIIETGLNIEQTKNEVERVKVSSHYRGSYKNKDLDRENLEEELQSYFGTKVKLRKNNQGAGYLKIEFYSQEELQAIVKKIKQ